MSSAYVSDLCSSESHEKNHGTFCIVTVFVLCVLLYRGALDIIRAHDGIFKQKKAYRDVFLPDAVMLRDRQVLNIVLLAHSICLFAFLLWSH